jgi:hypothetical protein
MRSPWSSRPGERAAHSDRHLTHGVGVHRADQNEFGQPSAPPMPAPKAEPVQGQPPPPGSPESFAMDRRRR